MSKHLAVAVLASGTLLSTTASPIILHQDMYSTSTHDTTPLITEELVDSIHTSQDLWQATAANNDRWPFHGWSRQDFQAVVMRREKPLEVTGPDFLSRNDADPLPLKHHEVDLATLPKNYDARHKYYDCQTLFQVRDQGLCSSCWAFGTTSAMSQRLCIHSNGTFQDMLSAIDPMTCCENCHEGFCKEGDPGSVYSYWKKNGIVTGDDFGSGIGCQPYPVAQYMHGKASKETPSNATCSASKCTNAFHPKNVTNDRTFAKEVYRIRPFDVASAMWEVYHKGPITSVFDVYTDFSAYKSGVYVKTPTANYTGGHTTVIVGWGEENGVPYWTCINSWNKLWGHHGFFKIRRGTNEAAIESDMTAGIPKF